MVKPTAALERRPDQADRRRHGYRSCPPAARGNAVEAARTQVVRRRDRSGCCTHRFGAGSHPLRILVVDPYYGVVLRRLYERSPHLVHESYEVQWRAVMDLGLGTADAHSSDQSRLGPAAQEVGRNCAPLQIAWAKKHAPRLARLPWRVGSRAILLA